MQGKTKPSIILINGSMNRNSFTKKLLEKMEVRLQENGASTQMINVRELALPVYDPSMELPQVLEKVSHDLIQADGLIVGAPEYHGSYTGAVKNLLDFFGFTEFENTPIALVTTTGGLKSGTNTLNHLRLVFRNLHGLVIPQQFALCKRETTPDLQFDEEYQSRFEKFIGGLEREVKKKVLFDAMDNK